MTYTDKPKDGDRVETDDGPAVVVATADTMEGLGAKLARLIEERDEE